MRRRRRRRRRGCVRPSLGPSARLSRVIFRRILGATCAVYPALFNIHAYFVMRKIIVIHACIVYIFSLLLVSFQGVGALYVRRRPRVRVEPIQSGGGQERGMRSGTVPTPLVS